MEGGFVHSILCSGSSQLFPGCKDGPTPHYCSSTSDIISKNVSAALQYALVKRLNCIIAKLQFTGTHFAAKHRLWYVRTPRNGHATHTIVYSAYVPGLGSLVLSPRCCRPWVLNFVQCSGGFIERTRCPPRVHELETDSSSSSSSGR